VQLLRMYELRPDPGVPGMLVQVLVLQRRFDATPAFVEHLSPSPARQGLQVARTCRTSDLSRERCTSRLPRAVGDAGVSDTRTTARGPALGVVGARAGVTSHPAAAGRG
jgi:hypothetical protein